MAIRESKPTILLVLCYFFLLGKTFLGPSLVSAQECPNLFSPTSVRASQQYNYSSPGFQSLFAALNSSIESYISQHRILSHAVSVVHENRTIFKSGLTSTPFRIASITKTFNALGAFMLRDQGRLQLDDAVKKLLPEFSILSPFGAHDTTIRELMGHSSGFPRDLCSMLLTCPNNETEVLQQIAGMQLIAPPWSDTPAYSNLGFSLLGRTWEKATRPTQSWEDFIMNSIVGPLNLTDTGVNITGVPLAPNAFPDGTKELGWSAPAAQMYSTTDDLAKYLIFLLNTDTEPRLISDASMREWMSPASIFSDGMAGFGTGAWELRKLEEDSNRFLVTKSGNINGYLSYIALDPPTKLGVVALTVIDQNAGGSPNDLVSNLFTQILPTVQNETQQILAAQYAGVYKCKKSSLFASPTLNYSVQFMEGSITVSVSPAVGLLGSVDFTLLNAGQKFSSESTWAFLLKNATENSFWFGDGTSCPSMVGAVSSGPDLKTPNAPGSLYTSEVVFDTEAGSLQWPAVEAHCYKAGTSTGAPAPRVTPWRYVGGIFTLLFFIFIF